MEDFRLTAKDKQDARMALLRYYSLQCVAHGAYLVAMAIGFIGFVEVTPFILKLAAGITFLPLSPELLRSIVFNGMLSVFIVLIVYVLGRTIFWSYLTSAILNVKPKEGSGVKSEAGTTTATFLQQLHEACFDYVKKKHKIWTKFYGLRAGYLALIWLDLFVVFLIISLIVLYIP